ncbi:MAG: hypothetical protein HY854_00590 [Burkholderiales bacterium]|nr:hypothetical protein [Burkholderiales bacterium]
MALTSATYQKSPKGAQAIATRDHSLAPKLRSLLILVDGKKGVDELTRVGAMLGDPQQLLAQLLEQGYIEPVQGSAPSAPAPAAGAPAVAAAAAPAHPAVPLAEAKRYAVRRLTDVLGPTGESLCLRIEGTRTAADFMQAIKGAEKVLRDFGGNALAERFMQDIDAHRPA